MRIFILLFLQALLSPTSLEERCSGISKEELKKEWPKAESVISNYTTVITFKRDEVTNKIEVVQNDTIDIVAVKSQLVHRRYYYDNDAYLGSFSLKADAEKKKRMNIVNGDDPSKDVFHSDLKFRHFSFFPDHDTKFYRFTGEKTVTEIRFFATAFLNDPVYPIVNRRYVVRIPEWLHLDIRDYNFGHFKIERNEGASGKTKTITYYANNLNNSNEGENSSEYLSPYHSYPHLLFLPRSHTTIGGEQINILATINDLFSWYRELMGDITYNSEILQPLLSEIVAGAASPPDSIKAIYYWVQDNIRYVAFEEGLAGFRPEKAELVYKNKYGDCKGMSNLLYALLKMAGFDAKLAWTGTNYLIYDYSTPSPAVDNHMICYLKYENEDYFLDATCQMQALGNNPTTLQGKQVLINYDSTFQIKTIPPKTVHESISKRVSYLKVDGDALTGKSELSYTGDVKAFLATALINIKQNEQEKFLKEAIIKGENTQCDSIVIEHITERDSTLRVHFNERINNAIIRFNHQVLLNLNSFSSLQNEKTDTTNCYHLFMMHKTNTQSEIRIEIPQNMKVVKLPPEESFSDGVFSYHISYTQNENAIFYRRELKIDRIIIYKYLFAGYFSFLEKYRSSLSKVVELGVLE